jgi:hypothetical protein
MQLSQVCVLWRALIFALLKLQIVLTESEIIRKICFREIGCLNACVLGDGRNWLRIVS